MFIFRFLIPNRCQIEVAKRNERKERGKEKVEGTNEKKMKKIEKGKKFLNSRKVL